MPTFMVSYPLLLCIIVVQIYCVVVCVGCIMGLYNLIRSNVAPLSLRVSYHPLLYVCHISTSIASGFIVPSVHP